MQELIRYLIGIILAISSGSTTQLGLVLQKIIINKYRTKEKFGRKLVKEPLWILGLFLELGVSAILLFLAIDFIGNTLTPGLMASGLIILVIFSIYILNEKLNFYEIIGVILMVLGIILLSLSGMSIEVENYDFLNPDFLIRLTIFTVSLSVMGIILFIINSFIKYLTKNRTIKAIILINIAGLGFSISNFWVAIMTDFLLNKFFIFENFAELILFIVSAITLVVSNIVGVVGNQVGLKYGQAANIIPIQQISVQISPIFYYLYVFLLPIPSLISIELLIIGISMIIVSTFLLGKRQEKIEEIKM
ncbi:MAG: hypothetical protein ACTSRP_14250 [Candidatus Helarchaeota archaeon]